MDPIKKFLWNRKYKRQINKCAHTARLLLTLSRLQLWCPSPDAEFNITARIFLNDTLSAMAKTLGVNKYISYVVK